MRVFRRFGAMLVLLLGFVTLLASLPMAASAAAKPQRGGTATVSTTGWTTLDPAQSLFSVSQLTIGLAVYDSLFEAQGAKLLPELALSYQYSNGLRLLTINLRPHVKFQDGTAFNAAAVKFNIQRFQTITSAVTPYFSDVASIKVKGQDQLIIRLTRPNGHLIQAFADTPATFMVSPSSLQSEGANQFGLMPVGAGPFKVVQNSPSSSLTLQAWPGYWGAKTRYLDTVKVLGISTGDQVLYTDVTAGALDWFFDSAQGTASILQEAKANPNVQFAQGSDNSFLFLELNTHAAPFSDIRAREALDYCTPRASLGKYLLAGFGKPAYILAGPGELYYPANGQQASAWPFGTYDVAKGTQLVNQAGGVTFTLKGPNKASEEVIYQELQAAWQQCGMHVTVTPEASSQGFNDVDSGNFQAYFTQSGGSPDPYFNVETYSNPSSASDTYGFTDSKVVDLITQTGNTLFGTKLTKTWANIYKTEDQLAVNIPLIHSPNYYIYSSRLHGVSFIINAVYLNHAWVRG